MKTLITILILLSSVAMAKDQDRYRNFAELARNEVEGQAYHVDVLNRRAPVTIVAIHGGKIEPGSDDLARAIAGSDFNLYAFIATLPSDNRRLHITSTHFDDPRALQLVKAAKFAISVHGFKETVQDRICVGGGNQERLERLASNLKKSGLSIEIESPCQEFGGSGAQNIVNLGTTPGVQLELSTHLRDRLRHDSNLMTQLAAVIRAEALR